MIRFLIFVAVMMMAPELAVAQQFPTDIFNTPIDGSVAAWIIRTFGLLTVLSVAPGILIMVTSFPRFVIAFSILRSGMGLSTTPSMNIFTKPELTQSSANSAVIADARSNSDNSICGLKWKGTLTRAVNRPSSRIWASSSQV